MAVCGVVFIHTAGDPVANLLGEVARFAVPLFFMLSGYFLSSPAKQCRRLIVLYAVWVAIYLAADTWLGLWNPKMPIVWDLLLRGGPGFHLWFISSLIQCVLIYLVVRRAGWTVIFMVAGVLYGTGLLFGTYGGLFFDNPVYNPRWGPAFGFVCVMIGRYVAENPPAFDNPKRLVRIALAFLAANYLELELFRGLDLKFHYGAPDVRFFTLPYAMAVFALVLWGADRFADSKAPALALAAALGRVSLGIYAVHVLPLEILKATGWFPPTVLALIVIVISAVISYYAARTPVRRLFA